jgi:hypothetical protein
MEMVIVKVNPYHKLCSNVIKKVRRLKVALIYGRNKDRDKDIYLLMLRKVNLLDGQKLLLVIVMVHFIRDIVLHRSNIKIHHCISEVQK